MNMQAIVSAKAADEVFNLIQEYLFEGGAGFDDEALQEFMSALAVADRIVIQGRQA